MDANSGGGDGNTDTNSVPIESIPMDSVPTDPVPTDSVPTDSVLTDSVPTDPVPTTDLVSTKLVPTDSVPTDPVPSDTVCWSRQTVAGYEIGLTKSQPLSVPLQPTSGSNPVMAWNRVLDINTVPNLQKSNNRLTACIVALIIFIIIFLVLFIVFLVLWLNCNNDQPTPAPSPSPSPTPPSSIDYRLPTALRPTHYDLLVRPYLPATSYANAFADRIGTFDGWITIQIETLQDTTNITLNAIQLNFTSVQISDVPAGIDSWQFDDVTGMVVIWLSSPNPDQPNSTLHRGDQFQLHIQYSGILRTDLDAFYYAFYEEDGQNKSFAVTQFESESARYALPCFDEPNYKATYYVQVEHDASMIALSNAPALSTKKRRTVRNEEFVVTQFDITPIMSSYLLAFFVGNFTCTDSVVSDTKQHTVFRACMRYSVSSQGQFGAEVGAAALAYYEKYFDVEFPLKKMDLLALPAFSAGAMENWGLITFREQYVLFDDSFAPTQGRSVASVIAHELAHQWFGDLVTMSWWSDLWLNEGFADFMSYQCVDAIFDGQYAMAEQMIYEDTQGAQRLDQLSNSHPIHQDAESQDQIEQLFDTITYSKGCGFINMLSNSLQPINYTITSKQMFQSGIQSYLKARQYGNADYNTFEYYINQAMTENGGSFTPNIFDFINRWILQEGFPVVQVTTSDDGDSHQLSPRLLTVGPDNRPASDYDYEWDVYLDLSAIYDNGLTVTSYKYTPAGDNTTLATQTDYLFYYGNYEAYNFVRYLYEEDNYRRLVAYGLTNATRYAYIDPRARSQIIDDAFNLAQAGLLNYTYAFCVSSYLGALERRSIPWLSYYSNLGYIGRMLQTPAGQGPQLYNTYMTNVTAGVWQYANNLTGHNINDTVFWDIRQATYSHACQAGYGPCTSTALSQFTQLTTNCANSATSGDCNTIEVLLRPTIYCTAVANQDASAYNFLHGKYQAEQSKNEKRAILGGLSCSQDVATIKSLVADTTNGFVDSDQSRYVYRYLVANPMADGVVWQVFTADPDYYIDDFPSYLTDIIESATANFNTQNEYNEVLDFVNTHSNLGRASQAFKEALSSIQANIAWMTDFEQAVLAALQLFIDQPLPDQCIPSLSSNL